MPSLFWYLPWSGFIAFPIAILHYIICILQVGLSPIKDDISCEEMLVAGWHCEEGESAALQDCYFVPCFPKQELTHVFAYIWMEWSPLAEIFLRSSHIKPVWRVWGPLMFSNCHTLKNALVEKNSSFAKGSAAQIKTALWRPWSEVTRGELRTLKRSPDAFHHMTRKLGGKQRNSLG